MDFENAEEVIQFFSEDTEFQLANEAAVRLWVAQTFEEEGGEVAALSYIFCSDAYLYDMNVQYLQHDTLTDVITFYYTEPEQPIEGDVFISIDRVKENAATFSVSWEEELFRVIVHGALHLLGYGDKTEVDKKEMTEKENYYLQKILQR